MDPQNPPVLLLGHNDQVIGVEWEAKDVGQGPMKMFGQTIELQSGHPGVPEPHYMLHIYFKPGGKVLFGTNDQTAFDPEGACPEMSDDATCSAIWQPQAHVTSSATRQANLRARRPVLPPRDQQRCGTYPDRRHVAHDRDGGWRSSAVARRRANGEPP